MLTVVIKRTEEPTVIQLTQQNIMNELNQINNSEMLLEDTWVEGLRKVRTPYVCLVEADCLLSGSYISSNIRLLSGMTQSGKNYNGISGGSHGGGGYSKLAMLSSCLGIQSFENRIYNYYTEMAWSSPTKDNIRTGIRKVIPNKDKQSNDLYPVQIGFVPGAIIRMSSIRDKIDKLPWDDRDLVRMSAEVSLYLWGTGRRVLVNPNTTYVSTIDKLSNPTQHSFDLSAAATSIFTKEGLR